MLSVNQLKITVTITVRKHTIHIISKGIGKVDGDEISNKFNIGGNIASLSLDVTAIVNDAGIVKKLML